MGAINITNVSFRYEDEIAPKDAGGERAATLNGVDLEIPNGQFLCLIGHSGGGKSTLLRLLLGLSAPTSGRITIDGKLVDGPDLTRSFVFQNYSLFPWMKVRRNVEFGIEQANKELGRGLSKAQIAETAELYLRRVGMLDAADKYPYQLSGGMQQRVAIARALAMDADTLFFDEPFGALDVKTRRTLQGLVEELWRSGERRKTVVFVTHDISEAILLADRVVFMRQGGIAGDYAVDLPRPRTVGMLAENDEARRLNKVLTELFYEDGEDDEDFEGAWRDAAGYGIDDGEGAGVGRGALYPSLQPGATHSARADERSAAARREGIGEVGPSGRRR